VTLDADKPRTRRAMIHEMVKKRARGADLSIASRYRAGAEGARRDRYRGP